MTIPVSKEASQALEWAFGPYAEKPPEMTWEICRVAEMECKDEITRADIDELAHRLIRDCCSDGLDGRISFGWCTYRREEWFGIGVMAFGKRK